MKIFGIKLIFLSALLITAGIMVSSCEDHPEHIESSWGDGMNVKDEVVLDGVTSYSLNIRATSKPSVSSEAVWLKTGEVKNLSTGIYTVELTAEINTTGETRSAILTVTSGKETATVTVIQLSSDVVLVKTVLPGDVLDPSGGRFSVTYAATGKPAVNLPEWITLIDSRALEDGTMSFSYTANTTGRGREGMIVLAVGTDAVANVTVTQPAL